MHSDIYMRLTFNDLKIYALPLTKCLQEKVNIISNNAFMRSFWITLKKFILIVGWANIFYEGPHRKLYCRRDPHLLQCNIYIYIYIVFFIGGFAYTL